MAQDCAPNSRAAVGVLALLVTGLAGFPNSVVAATPIAFHWPVPGKVSVSMTVTKDSTRMVMRSDIRLHQTPHPDELRVRSENVELLEVGAPGFAQPEYADAMAGLEALLAQSPPLTISRTGEYVRFSGGEEVLEGFIQWARKTAGGAGLPDSMWLRIASWLKSPEMQAQMEISASESWNLWVGHWLGLDLGPGEALEGELPFSFGGATIPAKVRVQCLGPARLDPNLTWLEMESVLEGEEARAALERYTRSLAKGVTGEEVPATRLFESFRRVDRRIVVLEARTARPSFARAEQIVEVGGTDGSRSTQTTSSEYFFEWAPPLGQERRRDAMPDSVIGWFRAGRFDEALGPLVDAAAEGSRHPDVYAYMGEIHRRSNRPGEAVLAARRALSLQPRHAFAHDVLACAFNPMFGPWRKANADSTWRHLLDGVAIDSTDGNLWLSMYAESIRRGRSDLERRSLRSLQASRFFTPSAIAYARWMLRDLPDSALLLTNGDMDSYPAWLIQALDDFRPDVAVVNISLLNTSWYPKHVRDRYRVPLPFSDAAIDSLRPEWREDSTVLFTSGQILNGWLAMRRAGTLSRPLLVSVSVAPTNLTRETACRLRLIGSAWTVRPDSGAMDADTTAMRRSLSSVVPDDFRGAITSERDRSPVRGRSRALFSNVVGAQLEYARALFEAGRTVEAEDSVRRAEDMARRADLVELSAEQVEETKKTIGGARK